MSEPITAWLLFLVRYLVVAAARAARLVALTVQQAMRLTETAAVPPQAQPPARAALVAGPVLRAVTAVRSPATIRPAAVVALARLVKLGRH